MDGMWQRFVRAFGDPELAALSILVALGGLVASVALLVHWLAVGQYAAAAGFMAVMCTVVGVCIRDYRRGRWSVLSVVMMTLWVLMTVVALAFGLWIAWKLR